MTSSFSLSTKTIFAGGRSRHQFGVFPGIGFEACGEVGHDWESGEQPNPDRRYCLAGVRR